ncbi:MAG: glycosyltransferase [Methylocystis sp.]|nr:glycosyltransferase [Methylocystis sp.]
MIETILPAIVVGCGVYWTIAVLLLLVSVVATIVQPWVCERYATRKDQPPVSIVLPVKLLEPGFFRAQASALEQDYPQFEAIASAVEPRSPAIEEMRAIFAKYPEVPSRVLQSAAKFAKSPKVDNLFAPFTEAANDVIFMKDADVVLKRDDLAQLLRHLADDVGLVCAIRHAAEPKNFAAHIEAAILNGPHGRMLFLAAALGQGFGVGKIMLFRRSDFLRAGGFAAIAHALGEDNAMAKAVKKIGLRCVFSHRTVRLELGARSFLDIYNRQLRWSVTRRDDETLSFLLEPLCQALPAFAAAFVAAPLAGMTPLAGLSATVALWFLLETVLSFVKGWRVSPSAPLIFLAREALMLVIWLRAWTTNRVIWAQDTLDVRADNDGAGRFSQNVAKEEG